jgi:hypothetical protein
MGDVVDRATRAALGQERFDGPRVSRILQVLGGLPIAFFLAYTVPTVLEPGPRRFLPDSYALVGIPLSPFAAILYAGGYLMLLIRARRGGGFRQLSRIDRLSLFAPALAPTLVVLGIIARMLAR